MNKYRLPERLLASLIALFALCMSGCSLIAPFVIKRAPFRYTVIALLFYLLLAGCLLIFLKRGSGHGTKALLRILTAFAFVIAIYYAVSSPLAPRVDLVHMIAQAKEMIAAGTHIFTKKEYFGFYPHNIPSAIIVYWLFRLSHLLFGEAVAPEVLAGVVNTIAVFSSVLLFYGVIDEAAENKNAAFLAKILILCNPVWIAFAGYYYTDTLSLPFLAGGMLASGKAVKKRSIPHFLISGLLFAVGIKIRVTTGIMVIAIVCILIYQGKWKDLAKTLVSFLAMFCLVNVLYGAVYNYHIDFDTHDSACPVTHFIMMGSHGSGAYCEDDVFFTRGFETHEEKVKQTTEHIKENLKQNGFLGNLLLIAKKEAGVFSEGTRGYAQFTMYTEKETAIHTWIAGSRSGLFKGILQAYNLLLLLLTAAGALSCRGKDHELILLLYYLGTILFTAIWELHPRQALTYMPVLALLALPFFEKYFPSHSSFSDAR